MSELSTRLAAAPYTFNARIHRANRKESIMDYFDAMSIVIYKGRPLLMYRWSGSSVWSSFELT